MNSEAAGSASNAMIVTKPSPGVRPAKSTASANDAMVRVKNGEKNDGLGR